MNSQMGLFPRGHSVLGNEVEYGCLHTKCTAEVDLCEKYRIVEVRQTEGLIYTSPRHPPWEQTKLTLHHEP